jgi:hypothetical protein
VPTFLRIGKNGGISQPPSPIVVTVTGNTGEQATLQFTTGYSTSAALPVPTITGGGVWTRQGSVVILTTAFQKVSVETWTNDGTAFSSLSIAFTNAPFAVAIGVRLDSGVVSIGNVTTTTVTAATSFPISLTMQESGNTLVGAWGGDDASTPDPYSAGASTSLRDQLAESSSFDVNYGSGDRTGGPGSITATLTVANAACSVVVHAIELRGATSVVVPVMSAKNALRRKFRIPFLAHVVPESAENPVSAAGQGCAASIGFAALSVLRAVAAAGVATSIASSGLGVNRPTAARSLSGGGGKASLGVLRATAARGSSGAVGVANFGIARALAARGTAGSSDVAIVYVNRGMSARGVAGATDTASAGATRALASKGASGSVGKAGLGALRSLVSSGAAGASAKAGLGALRATGAKGTAVAIGLGSLGISRALAARSVSGSLAQAGVIIGKSLPARGISGSIGKAGLGVIRALASSGVSASRASAGLGALRALAARSSAVSVAQSYLSALRAFAARGVASALDRAGFGFTRLLSARGVAGGSGAGSPSAAPITYTVVREFQQVTPPVNIYAINSDLAIQLLDALPSVYERDTAPRVEELDTIPRLKDVTPVVQISERT